MLYFIIIVISALMGAFEQNQISLPKVWWDKTTCLVSWELGSSGCGSGSFTHNHENQKSHCQSKVDSCAKNIIPTYVWHKILRDFNTCASICIKPVLNLY